MGDLEFLLRGLAIHPPKELDERVKREIAAEQKRTKLSRIQHRYLRKHLNPEDMFVVNCYYVDGLSLLKTSERARMTQEKAYKIIDNATRLLEYQLRMSL